eukprot:1881967-Amphidinium_carterae.1
MGGDLESEIRNLELGEEHTHKLLTWLQEHQPLLRHEGVPPEVLDFTRNMSSGNWVRMDLASGASPLLMRLLRPE